MTQKTSFTLSIVVVSSALVVFVLGSYMLRKQAVTPSPIREVVQAPTVSPAEVSSPTPRSFAQVPDEINNAGVRVQTQKKSYAVGEEVNFTITNNTQKNVYYFPETCASRIIAVLSLVNGRFELMPGPVIMCEMIPEVATLKPGGSVVEKVSEFALQQMGTGTYKLQFTYSYDSRERFALDEEVISQSTEFTLSK